MTRSDRSSIRYVSCFVIWLTLFTFYAMRSNMSIALLAMTSQASVENSTSYSSCITEDKLTQKSTPEHFEFSWTQGEQGILLASFFGGYMLTHVLGAVLSLAFGARNVMIVCLVGSTFFTFSMLYLPYLGLSKFIAGRVMIGLFSGPLYPILHELLALYAAESERTRLTVITHTGNIIGLAFNFGVGGYIVEHYPLGWKYLFIMNGCLGFLTLVLWCLFVYSSPDNHPFMNESEKVYIRGSNGGKDTHCISLKKVPFCSILTSYQVWIACMAQFGTSVILFAQLTGHPKYLSSVFGLTKAMASYLSIIPFISNFIFQLAYPFIFDFNRYSHLMTKTTYRRINALIGYLGSSVFLSLVGFATCKQMYLSLVFVTLSMIFLGANQSGPFTNMIDLSPRFSGIIMAHTSLFSSLSGLLQPQLASYLLRYGDRKEGYRLVFMITALMSFLMGVPFILSGRSEEQPWSRISKTKEDKADTFLLEEKI